MEARDLIESYVTDVAVRLPRKQRNDVAFELRALLQEELHAKAEETGRSIDVATATEFLRAFGRPVDVAARYRPTLMIIDPADGRAFLRATAIGLTIIWCLGLVKCFERPIASGWDVLSALGQWWGTVVIPSLWWPGMLVVGFGMSSWVSRRWPRTAEWKPRAGDRIVGGRAGLVMGLVGALCGLFVLTAPRWVLARFFGGELAPAAYDALTYTDTFLQRQAPILFVLLLMNVPLFLTVIVSGRWSTRMRRIESGLSLILCAVMAWTVLDGPILITPSGDRTAKSLMVLIIGFTLIYLGIKWHRSVRPTPSASLQG